LKQLWKTLTTPSARLSLGALLLGGALVGAGSLVAFDVTMHETSTDSFCLSCHELELNIGREYEGMSHAKNTLGVRVTCSDCHLPKPFVPKMMRKMRAVGEVYHHLIGTIDTPEKFEAHRMSMASRVWAEMNETDSRECRDCHQEEFWDLSAQTEKARDFHTSALSKSKTCIDCHKGVAHKLPEGIMPDEQIPGMDPMDEVAYR
jgi:cytochrome c-type protein NapC